MPHGSRRVGEVEILALCDGVVLGGGPATQSFPGATDAVWAETRERYPDVFDGDSWSLHVHCFAIRSAGHTILVDTGVGPESAPAFAWSATRGRLPEELAEAGVDPLEVDTVVITHVHDDHLGWNVVEGGAEPMFANARYVVHGADWDLMAAAEDEQDRAIFAAVLEPLRRAGVLDHSEASLELTPEVTVVHAPGHTPGHQVVLVDSGDHRAIVCADIVNNPVQLLQPGVNGTTDMDPDLAARTRETFLDRIHRERRLAAPAHLAEAFGRFVPDADRRSWRPE